MTIIESTIGIIIIGVFLNSLWYHYGKSVEIMNKAQLEQILKQKNDYRLKTYYRYLSSMINLYKWSFAELTTPIEFRGNTSLRINQIFTFSDLKDLYKKSIIVPNGFTRTVIEIYFEKQEQLIIDFKWLLSNFDLTDCDDLHQNVISYLTATTKIDLKESLLSNIRIPEKSSDKNSVMMSDIISAFIEKHEICPDPAEYRSHVFLPIILFYDILRKQLEYLTNIEEEFRKIFSINEIDY